MVFYYNNDVRLLRRFTLCALVLFLIVTLEMPSGEAVFGGTSALGDKRVVALINGRDSIGSTCSGALISSQIVVVAAHCLGNKNKKYDSEIYTPEDLWVAQPGADINVDDINSRVQVLRAILTAGFDNTFDGYALNFITQKDDITFLFLEKPLANITDVPIADASEVSLIKSQQLMFTHIGYGFIDEFHADGKPYSTQLRSYTDGASRHLGAAFLKEENTVSSQEIGTQALCVGDSGSPWYATVNGKEKIVAITVTASGCHGSGSGIGGTLGTVIHPYLHLVSAHWSEFLSELPTLRRLVASTTPDMNLPLIQTSGGCHGYVKATLQVLRESDSVWVDFAAAQGWKRIDTCPTTNPYQPWVRAIVKDGTQTRWHIWQPDEWDYFSPIVKYVAPKPTVTPKPVAKKTTITCTKGKLIKRVTDVKPVCPKGFKKK